MVSKKRHSKKIANHLFRATGKVVLCICIGINLLYLLSVCSPYISGRLVFPALLGLAFPLVLLAQLFVLIFWLLRRKWIWATINFALILLAYDATLTIFPMNGIQTIPATDSIQIISYNVGAFGFVEHSKSSPNPILHYLKENNADIVCLQEARLATLSIGDLKAYLPQYKYIHTTHAQPDRGSRLAILSKWPIMSTQRIAYPSRFNGSMAYRLRIKGRDILVINNHLESFKITGNDQKSYHNLARQGEAKKLSLKVVRKLIPAFSSRAAQAERVAKFVADNRDAIIISCGDFNDTPHSYTRHCMSQGLKDAFKDSGYGLGISFHSSYSRFLRARLDYILHSPSLQSRNCRVDNSIKTSDHYPISVTLYLPSSDGKTSVESLDRARMYTNI
ncbi:endonuclease/exonuclease/phosphatase family protein [Porphyromonas crevioricanis]|uniref:Uncharacterized protein conserved in bacteria n=1 Tax=Porphyromonas crevioricanis TaxID=393921 RepID=A0A2X4STW4_9PORP|nr:endonuclease/exonuclease/phosphatase family protein [Porphyromonas crevioricanis]GAD06772.1 AP endonuclease domain protein [Porphyromonas crevioricanis JCM 13913]SQH73271.1 Uncharacterized protein conserved in bacteria [Porphyromonas crevioricanis]